MPLNGTLLVLFLLVLVWEYRSGFADHLEIKRTGLDEQARILMRQVRSIRGPGAVRAYLTETRLQLEEAHPNSHALAADVNGHFVQSGIPRDEEENAARRLRAGAGVSTPFLRVGDKEFLLGRHRQGTTSVYVAEDLRDVHETIGAALGRHLVIVAVTLLCAVLVINGVLWVVFQRPLAVLTQAVGEIGSGKVGLQIERIGTREFDVLADAINDMSRALGDAESLWAAQMRRARSIQHSLQPARMQLDGAVVAHHFQPAQAVGGDYYDLFVLPDGSGLFCIADVTGHGVSAALVAAMVKICLLNAVEHSSDPGEILEFVNRRLTAMDLPEMFVTMLLVRLGRDPEGLAYAGAGHPSAILADGEGRWRELESTGPVLGIGADFSWATGREPFAPGARLLLFTDGITEAVTRESDFFGVNRLREILLATRNVPPAQAVQAIMDSLAEHCAGQPFLDDVTLVLADLRPPRRPTDDSP